MRFVLALAVFALAALAPASGSAQARVWYYCDTWHAYYPGVLNCPVPWRIVNEHAPSLTYGRPAAIGQPTPTSPFVAVPARPSFPRRLDGLDDWCQQVKLPSSIAICSDGELRALLIERQHAYDGAKARLSAAQQKALLADQNEWVKSYAPACGLASDEPPPLPLSPIVQRCMAQAGRTRIAYLQGYGSTRARETPPTQTGEHATTASTPIGLPSFMLDQGSENLPKEGPNAWCRKPEVIRSIIRALNTITAIKSSGETVIDFRDSKTLQINVKEKIFSCHGVIHVSNGQMLPGTFSVFNNALVTQNGNG